MSSSLAITILHARRAVERAANVRALLTALPGAVVVEDGGIGEARSAHGGRGCRNGAMRAWRRDVGPATHHLVIEDDAVPCERFAELALEAIERRPDAVILFFYGYRMCSLATSWPVEHVKPWLSWADEHRRDTPHHSMLQAQGARSLGVPLLYTVPSLVEHGPFDSLLGHAPMVADQFESAPSRFELRAR